jgi:hypothetical protein
MESIKNLRTAIKQLQNGERTCIGCVVRSVEKDMKRFHDDAFAFSAELTYKDRLIKEYEKELNPDTINSIKHFIFSEDDR